MRELMKKYRILAMNLADAAVVAVAERERIRRIFTIKTGEIFSLYRHAKLGKFMIVSEHRQIESRNGQGHVDGSDQSGFSPEAVIELAGFRIAVRHILLERGRLTPAHQEARERLDKAQPCVCSP